MVQSPSHYRPAPMNPRATERFALWVDGVGGYLVCLRDSVVIGQHIASSDTANASFAGNPVDIAIQADLSRKHVIVRRQNEAYFVEPLGPTKLEGRVIHHTVRLHDGEELQLGGVVRLRFRQPHPLSATARLEPVSFHRPKPFVDAVLLMSESLVLGPRWQNHVVCRDWASDLVLARQSGELFCRAMRPVEIDGQEFDGRGPLHFASRVSGDDFSICLEPV